MKLNCFRPQEDGLGCQSTWTGAPGPRTGDPSWHPMDRGPGPWIGDPRPLDWPSCYSKKLELTCND